MSAVLDVTSVFEAAGAGRTRLRAVERGALGIQIDTRAGVFTARADWPLSLQPDTGARDVVRGRVLLRRGETASMVLAYDEQAPAVLPVVGQQPWRDLDDTIGIWRKWSERSTFRCPSEARRRIVLRSALILKLLAYAPSGAIVAAPTTSLPERIGGDANWDYRYCWLREASMTIRALLGVGFEEEAQAFVDWMLHATRLSFPDLRILYDVYGNAPQPERTIETVSG